MVRGIVGSVCAFTALTLVTAATVFAAQVITGTVRQVDERSGVIVLDDGRQVQVTSDTTVLSSERPVERLGTLTPGSSVTVIVADTPSASPRLSPYAPEPNAFGFPSLQAP